MRLHAPVSLVPICLLPLLAACGSSTLEASPGVAIKATDTACEVARTTLPTGRTQFVVTNAGGRVTEVYVYGQQGGAFTKIVGEVENVGPGTSRNISVTLDAATYEVACKPGMTGNGIRTRVVASASSRAGNGSSAATTGGREVQVEATDTAIEGLDGFTAKSGETVRFVFENNGTGNREMGVLGADGALLVEAEAAAGAKGEATVTFGKAGAYNVSVHPEGKDDEDVRHAFTVS